jgi:hypothetical protein
VREKNKHMDDLESKKQGPSRQSGQVVEHLPSKCEALISTLSPEKKKSLRPWIQFPAQKQKKGRKFHEKNYICLILFSVRKCFKGLVPTF